LFAFLKTPNDFEKTILAAVNAGGDTDSRAAIAGSISGAYNGIDSIPRKWASKIIDQAAIMGYAEKLHLMRLYR
jgi:ADP-ribosylglycohydrolase